MADTRDSAYTRRLIKEQEAWWKRILDVQAPYRWNLRRLRTGYTLEIGCGIGRNLRHLHGSGVGIDHNAESVAYARKLGLAALTPDEFRHTMLDKPGVFDSLLLAHVLEHMPRSAALELVREYSHSLKPAGRLVLITPQEAGYGSDPSHVEFVDFGALAEMTRTLGFEVEAQYSFPFPRWAGARFRYNEFISVGARP
jgi:SAM-dependent methyltransferase